MGALYIFNEKFQTKQKENSTAAQHRWLCRFALLLARRNVEMQLRLRDVYRLQYGYAI